MTTTPILPQPSVEGGVLIASPSTVLREQVLNSFGDSGRAVREASGGADALVQLENGDWQLLFLDRRLPDLDTEELIGIIKRRFPGIEVVLLDSDSGQTVPQVRDREDVRGASHAGMAMEDWKSFLPSRNPEAAPVDPLPGMIGNAACMQQLYQMVRLVAGRSITVLVLGATGTGKELVANALHKLSPRATRPFVIVNCAAIPEALLESELLDMCGEHSPEPCSPTWARIQAASGGTLLLDEIGEMPAGLQAKLLRFLEQKEIQRLGSTDSHRVDVRVIAATNQNLFDRVAQGSFREDLYYRLSAFPVELPALADRVADIVPLAEHFLARAAVPGNGRKLEMRDHAVRILEAYDWPGNVRELEHVMERAAILAEASGIIGPEHLYFPSGKSVRPAPRGWAEGAAL